mgnify:FL=1
MIQIDNTSANDMFDGLSSKLMNYLVDDIYNEDSPVKIVVDNDAVFDIPMIKQVNYFLNIVSQNGLIKLTKIGNIPPAIVKDLYSQRFIVDEMIESKITKLTKETDSTSIEIVKIFCFLSGLIKKRNNSISLTEAGIRHINSPDLFLILFNAFLFKFNWAYFDSHEGEDIGKFAAGYTLYLLAKYGSVERDVNYYADLYFKAFPFLKNQTDAFGYNFDNSCYSYRTFNRFLLYFNFIENRSKTWRAERILTTDLFNRFIKLNCLS